MEHFEQWLQQHALLAQLVTTVVGSFATFVAVLVAWHTASSTRATVREMRETRLQAVRPVLYISARQRGFTIDFTPENSLYLKFVFRDGDKNEINPFEVRNAVSSPAFDVSCRWRLGAEVKLPENFKIALLNQAAERKSMTAQYKEGKILISNPADGEDRSWLSWEWPYDLSAETELNEILGDSAKVTHLPQNLWYQIACKALIALERRQLYKEPFDRIEAPLAVELTWSSPSGERNTKAFHFKLSLWWASLKDEHDKQIVSGSLPSTWKSIHFNGSLEPVSKQQVVLVNPTVWDLWAAVLDQLFPTLRRFLS